jgi:hypothetical protein
MKQRPRIYYTEAQKALMWDRWKAGDTLHEIGKLFDRPHSSIHNILSATAAIGHPRDTDLAWHCRCSTANCLFAGPCQPLFICS